MVKGPTDRVSELMADPSAVGNGHANGAGNGCGMESESPNGSQDLWANESANKNWSTYTFLDAKNVIYRMPETPGAILAIGAPYFDFLEDLYTSWEQIQSEASGGSTEASVEESAQHGLADRGLTENVEAEEDLNYLKSLSPRAWKEQDHYRVLGLHKYRFYASDDDIRRAYRRIVMRHHPDKRKMEGLPVYGDDDYFTCIQKAWEQLGEEAKRISYDSVDPDFDDAIPKEATKENFFEVYGPVFERNARWSEIHPVPRLGDDGTSKDQVMAFYHFWFAFKSWREFSYLDEEEKEKGESREERRWIEVQNRKIRKQKKVEEMNRLRKLVDTAYACDPRVVRFKDEEKEKKLAIKRAKEDARKARLEEEERARREKEEEERRVREAQEAEEKSRMEVAKQEKERARRLLRSERKKFRGFCKDANYFADNEEERVKNMTEMDKLCEIYDFEKLSDVNQKLSSCEDTTSRREAFYGAVQGMQSQLAAETSQMSAAFGKNSDGSSSGAGSAVKDNWSEEDLQLLIKAFNLFPAGTGQRWEVMATFINQHANNEPPRAPRTAKEVLAKAKDLQKSDQGSSLLKESANQRAFDKFKEQVKEVKIEEHESQRFDSPAEQAGEATWTTEEQKALEQALKTYPASVPDRWDRIADCVPNRTKKECMKRYKGLAELIRAKKSAQAAVAAKSKK